MRGTIRRRGDAWTLQVYAGRRADGTKRYVTRTHKGTRREADTALANLVTEVAAGQHLRRTDRLTVAELLDRWIASRAPDWSPKTAAVNRQIAHGHIAPAIGAVPLDRLTTAHIDGLYSTMRATLAASTVAKAHRSVLHPALGRAVRWGLIATNPAAGTELPTLDDHEIVVPDPDQVRRHPRPRTTPGRGPRRPPSK